MSETLYPPRLKWKQPPWSFWNWLRGQVVFVLLIWSCVLPWCGLKRLLTAEGIVLSHSEALKLAFAPPVLLMGSISVNQLSRLINERKGLAHGPAQTIQRRPQFSETPSIKPIVIGVEHLSPEKMRKCVLSVVAGWIIAYILSGWPFYSHGWVKHSLAFELLIAFAATIAACLVGIVPTVVNFARSLTLRIDEEGITSRTLRGIQFVPWEQIVTCKMVRYKDFFEAETVLVLTLQDYQRKTLLHRSLYASEVTLTKISQTMLRMLSVA